MLKNTVLILFVSTLFSCGSLKKIVYFQPNELNDSLLLVSDTAYIALIQPNDILNIYVASISAEASQYFNYSDNPNDDNSMASGYLVDSYGDIQMPLVGVVRLAGLTSAAARDTITKRLEKYIINPSVKLSIRNFRVTVIGEVAHPGIFAVTNERLTLPEALALAGDLTIYSNRQTIKIIRENKGIKEISELDLTTRDLFNSPYYFLHCNDIIYVEPTKKKLFLTQNYYRVLPVIFGGIALVVSIFALTK